MVGMQDPRAYRSMNGELIHGALDGTVRFQRPNSASADHAHSEKRAAALHPMLYGTMGLVGDDNPRIEEIAQGLGLR